MSVSQEITIRNAVGLHARPAALFVKTAAAHKCKITVANLSKNTQAVNAKSLLSVLSIAVMKGERILVNCEGDNERGALEALLALADTNFGEGG